MHLEFFEFERYRYAERSKWNDWFRAQSNPVWEMPLQGEGRFPAVWELLDHIFVVERRHTQRLNEDYPLTESTSVARGDWPALWNFGEQARTAFIDTVKSVKSPDTARIFRLPVKEFSVTPRKLAFHVLVHEIRHWSQIALAVRQARLTPPADQDLVYSDALA